VRAVLEMLFDSVSVSGQSVPGWPLEPRPSSFPFLLKLLFFPD